MYRTSWHLPKQNKWWFRPSLSELKPDHYHRYKLLKEVIIRAANVSEYIIVFIY